MINPKKNEKKAVLILSILFVGGNVFANYNDSQIAEFVQTQSTEKGRERTQQVYDKLNNKLPLLSGSKKELAQILLQEFKNSLENNFTKIIKREEAQDKDKWNLKDIYQSDDDFKNDIKKASDIANELGLYKGTLDDNSKLLEYLNLDAEFRRIDYKLRTYISLAKSIDSGNSNIDALSQEENTLRSRYVQNTMFFYVKIKEFSDDKLQSLINDPKFATYKLYFEALGRNKKNILSQDQEDIIAKFFDAYIRFSTIYSNLVDGDIVFPEIVDPQGNKISVNSANIHSTLNNSDREFRKEYLYKYYNTYASFKNTLGSLLVSHFKEATTNVKIRNFDSVLQSSYLGNNLDPKMYDNLLDTTKENLKTFHRYLNLRKEYLGLDEIHYYDTFITIGNITKQNFTYEEAKKNIITGLAMLGSGYISLLQIAFDNNWIDVYQSDKKLGGFTTSFIFGSHPFVLINFNNTFDDIDKLTHELGHAINYYLSAQKQTYFLSYPSYPMEVASITNEFLLLRGLAEKSSSDEEKLFYLDKYLSVLYTNYWKATMYAEFEKQMYQKVWNDEPITTEILDDTFESLWKEYYGSNFVYDDYLSVERAINSNFFNTYYSHESAISSAAANKIATDIYNNKYGFIEKYMNYLSAGNSLEPIDLLKTLDIDMTKPEYLKSISDTENEILDEMDSLISKIKTKK